MEFLSGWKTHIISWIAIGVGIGNLVVKFLAGEPITIDDFNIIFGGVAASTLRSGVAKSGQ